MIATFFLIASQAMTFTADRIAADGVTHALAATGHVVATSGPITLRGESLSRAADGTMTFSDPTYATTCSNELGHTHWNVTGEIVYKAEDSVILRNVKLRLWEVPVFWLPYMYYPLDTSCGFSWMPGYTSRWGAYLLTRTRYHLLGDENRDPTKWWLDGATRFDLRYEQGVAFGEDLKWNLGDFGRGDFNFYYAYDISDDIDDRNGKWYDQSWGSTLDKDRYGMSLAHRWDPTERDSVRVRGSYFSDSYFRRDFYRKTLFNWKSQFVDYPNSGVFWEHLENAFALGAEVSGRLNEFYTMTGRLPELYLDVNPQPVFGLPLNYESENRIGYLTRDPAEYGRGEKTNPFSYQPGRWAEYEAFRFDTYHRLTAPFKVFDDVLSVVPRVGYRGTFWNRSGADNLTGWGETGDEGNLYRSILEGGVTFAARATGWVDETWRHVMEPYFDVLAQEAWMSGSGDRPYVFDSLDASTMWEDQFAGRSRNLPYSYYGVTPGFRNVWQKAKERGGLADVFDLDVYSALQFNDASYRGSSGAHRLAKVGEPNYGNSRCLAVPGARMKWTPSSDISLAARIEYDAADNAIPMADAGLQHVVSESFKWHIDYAVRDFRIWDYSSTPATPAGQRGDSERLNFARFQYVEFGFENHPIDWFAWSPYVRWDIHDNELDCVGSWFDLLTDCLGFRFIVEYENSFMRLDGYEHGDDWSFGFYIYLRAFGSGASDIFRQN